MTLRARLAIAFAALAAVVAVLMGALGYLATASRLQQEVDASLLAAAQRVLAGPRGVGGSPEEAEEYRPGRESPDDDSPGGAEDFDSAGDERSSMTAAVSVSARQTDPRHRSDWLRFADSDDDPPALFPRLRGEEGLAVTAVAADGRYLVLRGGAGATPIPPQPADFEVAGSSVPRSEARTQEVADTQYRVVTTTDGNSRTAVVVGRDWSEQAAVLRSLALIMAVLALALSGVAAVAGWLIARRTTRRLELLTSTAEAVSDTGRLDQDVPGTGPDEVGRLAGAFNAMLGRLAQSQSDQQRLVQDAGHELRTPLTSMRTNISLLQRLDELSPDVRERVLADLRGESRELTELVNELLEVATGTMADGEPEPVVLADIVERVVARARRKTDRTVDVRCDETTVTGRPHQLERAVWNLVDNAVKFDPDGSPITITVERGELAVADRGPGIGDDDRTQVFDRFYRPVSSRSLPGSGLGLAIVRDVAIAHGATVAAEPRNGGGTVFRLSFAHWSIPAQ